MSIACAISSAAAWRAIACAKIVNTHSGWYCAWDAASVMNWVMNGSVSMIAVVMLSAFIWPTIWAACEASLLTSAEYR